MKILNRISILTEFEARLYNKIIRWAESAARYDQVKFVRVHHGPRKVEGQQVLCRPIMTRVLDNGTTELWVNFANLYHADTTGLRLSTNSARRHLNSDEMREAELIGRQKKTVVRRGFQFLKALNRSENPDQLTSRRVRLTIDLIRALPSRVKRKVEEWRQERTVTVRMKRPKAYSMSESERRSQARWSRVMNRMITNGWDWDAERGLVIH